MTAKPPEPMKLPLAIKYANTCLAAMGSSCIIHPLDLIKTRMQIGCNAGMRGTFPCLQSVVLNEGVIGLYKGISAALLRQATYVTTRIGTFVTMSQMYRRKMQQEPLFGARLTMAVISGSIGGMIGTPTDVVLIRMESDGHAPKSERRNYKNVADGIWRIWHEEGFLRLYTGIVPTMIRAAISNSVLLLTYPYFKQYIKHHWNLDNGLLVQFSASMLSAFLVSIFSMPHDMAKTRIQDMRYKNGVPEYSGTLDVWARVIKEKGTFGLYRGFTTYYARMAPYTVLVCVFVEQLNGLYFLYNMGVKGEARWI